MIKEKGCSRALPQTHWMALKSPFSGSTPEFLYFYTVKLKLARWGEISAVSKLRLQGISF